MFAPSDFLPPKTWTAGKSWALPAARLPARPHPNRSRIGCHHGI